MEYVLHTWLRHFFFIRKYRYILWNNFILTSENNFIKYLLHVKLHGQASCKAEYQW